MSISISLLIGCYPGGALYVGKNENFISTRVIASLEKKYGLTVTKGPEFDNNKVVMPERSKPKKNELEKALRTGNPPVRLVLQNIIDEAIADSPSIRDFADRLMAADIVIKPNIASTGRLNGLAFELDGIVFGGSKLGKKYGWNQLQKQLDYKADRDNGLLQRLKEVARKNDETKSSAGSSDRQSRSPEKASQNSERDGQVNGRHDKSSRKISPEVSERSPLTRTESKQLESHSNPINSGPDSNRKHFIIDDLNNQEVTTNDRSDSTTGSSGKKPGITKIGARPPAQVRNRMPNMSLRHLDQLSGIGAMLLPGNVFDELEQSRAYSDQGLRWPLSERTTVITPFKGNTMTQDKLKELIAHRVLQQRNEDATRAFDRYVRQMSPGDSISELRDTAEQNEYLIFEAISHAIEKTGDGRLMVAGREIVSGFHAPLDQQEAETAQDEVMGIVKASPDTNDNEIVDESDEKPIIVIQGKPKANADPVEKAEQLRRNEEFLLTLQLAFEQRGNSYYHKQTGKLAFVDEGEKIKGYKGLLNRDGSQNMTAHKAMSQAAQIKFGDEFKSSGSHEYLKASWLSAALIGCNDTGYQPEARDLDMLSDMIKEHTKKYKRAPKLHAKTITALDEHEANLRHAQKHMRTASGGKSEAEIKAEEARVLNQKQTAKMNISNMVDRFRNRQDQKPEHGKSNRNNL